MICRVPYIVVIALIVSQGSANPLYHPTDHTSLGTVNEITSRLAPHPGRLQDTRLPPNIETIKKVAQILIMIGEQVIPGIIGEPPPHAGPSHAEEIPNDPVADIQT